MASSGRGSFSGVAASAATADTVTLLRALGQAGWRPTVVVVGHVSAGALLPLAVILAAGRLVSTIASAPPRPHGDTTAAIILVVGVFIAQLAVGAASGPTLARVARTIDFQRSQATMRSLLAPVGVTHLEDPGLRDDLARAQGAGIGATVGAGLGALAAVATRRAQAAGAVVVLAAIDTRLAALIALVQLSLVRFWQHAFRRLTTWATERTPELRRGDWFRDTAMGAAAAKEVRLFGLGAWFADRFHDHWMAGMGPVWAGWRARRTVVAIAVLAPAAATGLAALVLGRRGLDGVVTVATVVVGIQAALSASSLATANEGSRVISAAGAAARAQVTVARAALTADSDEDAQPLRRRVTFDDVGFRYPGRETWALRHLDLEIEAGRSTAIVGVNGAGKTTLVRLLTRLLEPTEGTILVDGRPLEAFSAESWRRQLAVVFQDFARYHLPLRDNVGFGCLDLRDDPTALDRAAERAGLSDIASRLPSSWDTPLARHLSGGTELSGGEWQRVALARALLAVDGGARLLVLDEPVASLDVRAEADLNERFLSLTQGLTTVVISHRFSTVRPADTVAVIGDGRVIQQGTHDELMATGGPYQHLFDLQAARFRDSL